MATREVFTETGSSVRQLPPEAPLEKLQIRNVLCPMDFSEFSRRAFHYAAGIARHFRSRLFVQHTVQIPTWTFLEGAGPSAPHNAFQAELRQAEKEIRLLSSHAGLQPSEVLVLIQEGDARDRILQTIQEQSIDLLVMGTHGRKGFRRLALGSVTEHIIHEAVCPVLVVSRPQGDFVSPQTWQPTLGQHLWGGPSAQALTAAF